MQRQLTDDEKRLCAQMRITEAEFIRAADEIEDDPAIGPGLRAQVMTIGRGIDGAIEHAKGRR